MNHSPASSAQPCNRNRLPQLLCAGALALAATAAHAVELPRMFAEDRKSVV